MGQIKIHQPLLLYISFMQFQRQLTNRRVIPIKLHSAVRTQQQICHTLYMERNTRVFWDIKDSGTRRWDQI